MRINKLLGRRFIPCSMLLFLTLVTGMAAFAHRSESHVPGNNRWYQQQKVSGSITDDAGNAVPGVSIHFKNAPREIVASDDNGFFSIELKRDNGPLVFEAVGFQPLELPVTDGATSLKVTMVRKVKEMEDVVVVGYGTMKKKDLTGAVGYIKGDAIANRNQPQLSQALQGAIAGVMVTRDNGAPGSSSTIRVRGITTIGDNSPLILVDGVAIRSIDMVSPTDVESISVLKDAASASIYGSRAAAGVILITTKRAKTNQKELNVNYTRGIEKPSSLPKYADAIGYMNMVNELRWNDVNNIPGSEYAVYTKPTVDDYSALHAGNADKYPNTDWMNVLLKDHVNRESVQVGFVGGSPVAQTKATLGYDRNDGLYIGKNYQRVTVRINNNITVSKNIKAFIDLNALRAEQDDPSESPMTNAYRAAPIYAAVWQNGLVGAGKDGNNMYAQLLMGGNTKALTHRLFGRAGLDITPFKGFKLTGIVAPEFTFSKSKALRKKVQYTNYDDPNTYVGTTDWGLTNSLTELRSEGYGITSQLLANYNTVINSDHDISVLAGYEGSYWTTESLTASSNDMSLNAFPYLDLGNPNNLQSGGDAYENAYRSYLGRINYAYKGKYLFQGNIRYDGSSRFHKDYRWGAFPSFSVGWVLSEEGFMQSQKLFQHLKLRASWGILGNERIGNYPYQSTIDFTNALIYEGTTVVSAQTAAQIAYAIQSITWEKTSSYNLGIDLAMLDNRLNVTADVYRKNTSDMLLELEIPDFTGLDNPDQNAGKMHTNGWELQAEWRDRVGDFTYGISANISDSKSVLDDLSGIQFLGDKVKLTGSQFDEWYGYRSTGIYQTQADVDAAVRLYPGVKPGDIGYQDISGPDGKPDGLISQYDKTLLGGSLPRYLYGGNINLGYKNFDLTMTFQGVGMQRSQLTPNMVQPYQGSWGNVPLEIVGNSWSVYNEAAANINARYPRYTNTMASNNYAMSDFWLANGSYFRIKNLVIGYQLPARLVNKAYAHSCRIYLAASDFFTVNHYPDGWDPEVSNTGYPISKSFLVGFSLNF